MFETMAIATCWPIKRVQVTFISRGYLQSAPASQSKLWFCFFSCVIFHHVLFCLAYDLVVTHSFPFIAVDDNNRFPCFHHSNRTSLPQMSYCVKFKNCLGCCLNKWVAGWEVKMRCSPIQVRNLILLYEVLSFRIWTDYTL